MVIAALNYGEIFLSLHSRVLLLFLKDEKCLSRKAATTKVVPLCVHKTLDFWGSSVELRQIATISDRQQGRWNRDMKLLNPFLPSSKS